MRRVVVVLAAVLGGVGLLVETSGCGSGVSYRPLVPGWPTDSEVQGQSVPSDEVFIVAELYDPDDALVVRLDLDRRDGGPLDVEQVTWIFGDGTTGSGCPALHTYVRDGEYQVQARILPAGSDNPYNVSLQIPLRQFAVEIETIPEVPQGRAPMTVQLEADVRLPWEQEAVRYRWDLGDGRVVEDEDAFQHTYAAPGAYPIRLTVVTDSGWSRTDTLQAFVATGYNQPPHAVADAEPAGGTAPLTVLLYGGDSSDPDGQVVAYNWRFGDGQSAGGPLAEHVYAQEGDYVATLTVTDDEGDIDTAEVLVSVDGPSSDVNHSPIAVIDADPTEGAAPLAVRFDASFSRDPDGDAIIDYQWEFGDGQTGSGQVVHHTYEGAGEYWAGLTVTDDSGAIGTTSALITVEAAAPQMAVSPGGGLISSGRQGGPFNPPSKTYTVQNTGTAALNWAAARIRNWVSLSTTGGTLNAGASQAVVVSINAQADNLGAGSYDDTVTFTNLSNGVGNASRSVYLTVESPESLSVTPGDGLAVAGPEGGPFSLDWKTYTVSNPGTAPIDWSVSTASDWLDLSRTGGTLVPGGSDTVVVSVNAQADSMPAGGYGATVEFANVTSGNGDTTRAVSLWISSGSVQAMAAASRTSGVATLAVFFDAVDAASGVVQPADGNHANVYYRWDFGDPGSGTWSTSGRSRNQATGYVAAHVYERPGSYTVTLTVTESAGATYQYEQQIEVQSFGGTTYYVSSSSGSDANDGRSPSRPLRTLDAAMSRLGTNRRILLKRGDTWRVASGIWIGDPGPGIIGAYYHSDGSDDLSRPKPHIVITSSGSGMDCGGPWASDWRIMD
ncbi:MAG TPA: PKD domain-containing protein, partial [Phycisphaerae bacterium]|nr:PKD domain-containing protein [Phycisphaerae bacterium]